MGQGFFQLLIDYIRFVTSSKTAHNAAHQLFFVSCHQIVNLSPTNSPQKAHPKDDLDDPDGAGRADGEWSKISTLGGDGPKVLPLSDRCLILSEIGTGIRMLRLLKYQSMAVDGLLYLATGQQPSMRVKDVANSKEDLRRILVDEARDRDGKISGFPSLQQVAELVNEDSDGSRILELAMRKGLDVQGRKSKPSPGLRRFLHDCVYIGRFVACTHTHKQRVHPSV